MKNIKKITRNALYILISLVFSMGCYSVKDKQSDETKIDSLLYETRKCLVKNIDIRLFDEGKVLAVGDSGKIIEAASQTPHNEIIGIVIDDSVHIFKSGRYTFTGVLAN